MMKKSKLILLLVLILLIATYFLLKKNRPIERTAKVFDIDTLSVNRIEVFNAADTIRIEKKNNIWTLVHPVSWAADTLKIQSLFRDVVTASYSKTPMGTGKEAIERFRQKEQETLHLVVANDKKSIHVLFSNLGNPYDYFRYAGLSKIYQLKTKVTNVYTTELYTWRSPHVVSHKEEDLLKIEVSHPKNNYTLTRRDYDWFFKDKANDFMINTNNIALVKILSILQNLDTYVFLDNEQNEWLPKFQEPYCTLKLYLTNNRTQVLKFVDYQEGRYLMMIDDDPTIFFVVVWDSVFRFTRHPDVFKMQDYGM